MHRSLAAVALVLIAGCASERPYRRHLAGPIPPTRGAHLRSVTLSTKDVLGEPVRLGTPDQKRIAVVFFMSPQSKDESAEFVRDVDEKLLDRPVDPIGIVDVRAYSGLTRPIAEWQLRKSVKEARERRRKRREERQVDASLDVINRWHLIGDFDGALFKKFDVDLELERPLAFVVERTGTLHGPYRDVAGVAAAVHRVAGRAAAKSAQTDWPSRPASRRTVST
jgi:hypothetical protein